MHSSLFGIFIISLSLLPLVLCQDADLVGRWEHIKWPRISTYFDFFNNGTFEAMYSSDTNYECWRTGGTYTVDTRKSPRTIDLKYLDPHGPNFLVVLGIYEITPPTASTNGRKKLNMSLGCDACYINYNTSRPSNFGCGFSMYNYTATSGGSDPNLVGNWMFSDARNASTLRFGSDGSFFYSMDCYSTVSYTGTYKIMDMNRSPIWLNLYFPIPRYPNYFMEAIYNITTTSSGRKELKLGVYGLCTPSGPDQQGSRPTQFSDYLTTVWIPGSTSTTSSSGGTTTGTTGTTGVSECGPSMSCQQCIDACAMTCKYTGCALDLCNSDCKRYNCGMFCGGTKRMVTLEVWE